jgi:hypothetical protein
MFSLVDPLLVFFVVGALAFWATGFGADVKTTAACIARHGVGGEQNPIARALFRRFGPAAGFAIVGALELAIIGTFAVAALAAAVDDVEVVGYASAVGSIVIGGLGHLLAAYGNARGRVVAVLVPVARLYAALDRAFAARGSARVLVTPARRP